MADPTEYRLDEIEIVAHDSMPRNLLPSVLVSIFQLRQPPYDLIMPSYRIEGDRLIGGALDSQDALEEMVWLKEAVRLPEPIQPLINHVLWMDEDSHVYYRPQEEVLEHLRQRAEQWVAEARDALRERRLDNALTLAQRAISADEDCYDAVVIKAAVYTVQRKASFVEELRHLAKAIDPCEDFDVAVHWTVFLVPSSPPPGPSGREFFQTDIKKVQPFLESAGFPQAVPV